MTKSLTVATFDNVGEAEILRQELEDVGVKAWLSNDTITVTLWHVGSALGGVKVQIEAEDETIALKLISERQRRRRRNREAEDWYCGVCREWISPSFDICWSCRGARDEVAKQPPSTATPELIEPPDDETPAGLEATARVDRSWRASIVGWFLCPPIFIPPLIHIYSLWVAAGVDPDLLDAPRRRALNAVWVSNLIAFAVFLFLWSYSVWWYEPADPSADWYPLTPPVESEPMPERPY